jgi:hypothetical protein
MKERCGGGKKYTIRTIELFPPMFGLTQSKARRARTFSEHRSDPAGEREEDAGRSPTYPVMIFVRPCDPLISTELGMYASSSLRAETMGWKPVVIGRVQI